MDQFHTPQALGEPFIGTFHVLPWKCCDIEPHLPTAVTYSFSRNSWPFCLSWLLLHFPHNCLPPTTKAQKQDLTLWADIKGMKILLVTVIMFFHLSFHLLLHIWTSSHIHSGLWYALLMNFSSYIYFLSFLIAYIHSWHILGIIFFSLLDIANIFFQYIIYLLAFSVTSIIYGSI